MNTTLLILLAVVAVYVFGCFLQWRRLTRDEGRTPE